MPLLGKVSHIYGSIKQAASVLMYRLKVMSSNWKVVAEVVISITFWKISFMISEAHLIFTLNISVANSFKFLRWTVEELPFNPLLLTRYAHVLLRPNAQIIFYLRCQNYVSFRTALMNELSINCEIVSLRPSALLEVILYGDKTLNDKSNHRILTTAINYIKNSYLISTNFRDFAQKNPFLRKN